MQLVVNELLYTAEFVFFFLTIQLILLTKKTKGLCRFKTANSFTKTGLLALFFFISIPFIFTRECRSEIEKGKKSLKDCRPSPPWWKLAHTQTPTDEMPVRLVVVLVYLHVNTQPGSSCLRFIKDNFSVGASREFRSASFLVSVDRRQAEREGKDLKGQRLHSFVLFFFPILVAFASFLWLLDHLWPFSSLNKVCLFLIQSFLPLLGGGH